LSKKAKKKEVKVPVGEEARMAADRCFSQTILCRMKKIVYLCGINKQPMETTEKEICI